MRILLDCDGLIAHFTEGACRWAAQYRSGFLFAEEDITDYDIMRSFGFPEEAWSSFRSWLSDTRFCRSAPLYEGAQDFFAELSKLGEVLVVTAPFVGVDRWEGDRRAWLGEHFGVRHKDLIFCSRKELVAGDVLIDDSPSHVMAFAKAQPWARGILFDRPWNRTGEWPTVARSYADALRLVRESVVGV